jgi:transposase
MITPDVNTCRMSQFLEGLAWTLGPDDLAIVVLDNAGWHRAKALSIPPNLVLLPLPSYSPELNPTERLWLWLRSHHLANRVYADYDDLLHAPDTAMASLNAERIRSVCACSHLTPPN